MLGRKSCEKATVNKELKELTILIQKERDTPLLHNNKRRNLVSDEQIASTLTTTELGTETITNNSNDVT